MKETQPESPHRRLQALLAISEHDRTEAQWSEINELEIKLAPANQEGVSEHNVRCKAAKPAGHVTSGDRSHSKHRQENSSEKETGEASQPRIVAKP